MKISFNRFINYAIIRLIVRTNNQRGKLRTFNKLFSNETIQCKIPSMVTSIKMLHLVGQLLFVEPAKLQQAQPHPVRIEAPPVVAHDEFAGVAGAGLQRGFDAADAGLAQHQTLRQRVDTLMGGEQFALSGKDHAQPDVGGKVFKA